jgi:hypothetical protein
MKRIPVSRDSPDEPRRSRIIIERRPDLGHEIVETRVGDERSLPELLEKLRLGDRLGPPIEKQFQ